MAGPRWPCSQGFDVDPMPLRMARIQEQLAELQDMLTSSVQRVEAQQTEAATELEHLRARLLDALSPVTLRRTDRLKRLAMRLEALERGVGREQAECVKVMEAVLATVERNGKAASAVCQHLAGSSFGASPAAAVAAAAVSASSGNKAPYWQEYHKRPVDLWQRPESAPFGRRDRFEEVPVQSLLQDSAAFAGEKSTEDLAEIQVSSRPVHESSFDIDPGFEATVVSAMEMAEEAVAREAGRLAKPSATPEAEDCRHPQQLTTSATASSAPGGERLELTETNVAELAAESDRGSDMLLQLSRFRSMWEQPEPQPADQPTLQAQRGSMPTASEQRAAPQAATLASEQRAASQEASAPPEPQASTQACEQRAAVQEASALPELQASEQRAAVQEASVPPDPQASTQASEWRAAAQEASVPPERQASTQASEQRAAAQEAPAPPERQASEETAPVQESSALPEPQELAKTVQHTGRLSDSGSGESSSDSDIQRGQTASTEQRKAPASSSSSSSEEEKTSRSHSPRPQKLSTDATQQESSSGESSASSASGRKAQAAAPVAGPVVTQASSSEEASSSSEEED
eukprot:TRINITY_DN18526_c0_g1_i2.p1 TRINITY_DN18526_c0_g1~~TRINITY_DN18526_c0_g1_i2.p1  ORF type:complete len:578 (+),score=144.20 TRINITY_DN18526_c0_g1_i2:89-1822(+)